MKKKQIYVPFLSELIAEVNAEVRQSIEIWHDFYRPSKHIRVKIHLERFTSSEKLVLLALIIKHLGVAKFEPGGLHHNLGYYDVVEDISMVFLHRDATKFAYELR